MVEHCFYMAVTAVQFCHRLPLLSTVGIMNLLSRSSNWTGFLVMRRCEFESHTAGIYLG